MTDIEFRVSTATKHKASAIDLRTQAMASDSNATALEWVNRVEFLAEEAIKNYLRGEIDKGDELFRASSEALEKASAALAA